MFRWYWVCGRILAACLYSCLSRSLVHLWSNGGAVKRMMKCTLKRASLVMLMWLIWRIMVLMMLLVLLLMVPLIIDVEVEKCRTVFLVVLAVR